MVQIQHDVWREWRAAVSARDGTPPAPGAVPDGESPAAPAQVVSLDDSLAEIRRLRRNAEAAGAMTAVGHLFKQEAELVKAIEAREAERAARARRDIPAEEKMAILAERIRAMPDTLREALRVELGW